ncbi:MAG: Rieske (2Fe-2S) protein [Candidatus Thermoplasmatota archaeon]|nr:Rieske (2Fe-2S) protein [Candidatus Thermoplasmatota archaeon]MCL5253033.1 Rieske (2Fe-2S) protein [Candidatus Thermoplasmatota archaeon]
MSPNMTDGKGKTDRTDVCSVDELMHAGVKTVTVSGRPVALFYEGGRIYALDNRCPHMGYPLSKGTLKQGMLTCHWHHARFDAESGCTFDLFADDAAVFEVRTHDGRVFIEDKAVSRGGSVLEQIDSRLRTGIVQSINLVIAKSIIREVNQRGLEEGGKRILSIASAYGTVKQRGWASGLTILTCMGNIIPFLDREWAETALFKGVMHVAGDYFNGADRPQVEPLGHPVSHDGMRNLSLWLRTFVEQREPDAAMRTLLTMAYLSTKNDCATALLQAATDHIFIDGGHVYDFINKAFDLLDTIGWESAPQTLLSVVRQLCNARRHEEDSAWRNPVDIASLLSEYEGRAGSIANNGGNRNASAEEIDALAWKIVEGEPEAILSAIESRLKSGWTTLDCAFSLTLASAFRIALFHDQNEFDDWITVLHAFTYSNAVYNSASRVLSNEPVIKAIYHGAMNTYLNRFLNMPAADIDQVHSVVSGVQSPLDELEKSMNAKDVGRAKDLVNTYLARGGEILGLMKLLAKCVLREDAEFHTYQLIDACMNIVRRGKLSAESARLVAIAAARYVAAHSPTDRADLQTFSIASRLERGETLYASDE